MSEVLTVQDAAGRAKLSDKTIYAALRSGELSGSKVGAHWRLFADDLELWLRSLRATPKPPPTVRRAVHRRAGRGSLRALSTTVEEGL